MAEGGDHISAALSEQQLGEKPPETMNISETADVLASFLERTRSERLNELRQIQHENRPVTGQSHRQNIGQFVAKNLEVRDTVSQQHASGKENVPLNSPNVEEHRPEAVVVEIQGLSQQQRVSNVLQMPSFRRQLESIIRGSFNSVAQARTSSPRPSASVQNAQTNSAAQPPPPAPVPAPRTSIAHTNLVETPTVPPVSVEPERRDSISSGTNSSTSSVDYNMRIQDPRGLLRFITEPHPAPLPPFQAADGIGQVAPNPLNIISQQHHEDLIQEVSELVHRRLVTSTLEGEFRNVLEFHIRERVEASGTEGQRVQEFVQSIQPSQPHIRNDFSNLGIPVPAPVDNWDNVSVTSISAAAVPYTQTNLYMSREIAALKAQLQEMKNMMKISFDLQMDIQRSIRQEVAAGIAAASGGPMPKPDDSMASLSTPKARPISDTHCIICLDNHSDSVLYQCGHMCVCFPCGRHLMERGAKCPVCRAPIRDIIRAYKCNED